MSGDIKIQADELKNLETVLEQLRAVTRSLSRITAQGRKGSIRPIDIDILNAVTAILGHTQKNVDKVVTSHDID